MKAQQPECWVNGGGKSECRTDDASLLQMVPCLRHSAFFVLYPAHSSAGLMCRASGACFCPIPHILRPK